MPAPPLESLRRRCAIPTYNKLVRDRVPELIEAEGRPLRTRVLDRAEYLSELRAKLIEEAHEYLAAESDPAVIDELADISEVLRALAAAHGFTPEQVEAVRVRKADARGGFATRVFLIDVEDGAPSRDS